MEQSLFYEIYYKMHTSPKHLALISALRSLPKEKQSKYKNTFLPCFTISGYFESNGKGSRNAQDKIYHTGLICLDLDAKDANVNLKDLKNKIINEPFVAYCGDSCRGEGIFAIIHISEPENHMEYFDFFKTWLDLNGCLSAFDKSTKNINRLRFIAPDNNFYINDNAKPLPLPIRDRKIAPVLFGKKITPENVYGNNFQWCVEQTNKKLLFIEFQRHEYIIQLARYCNIKGLSINDTMCGCLSFQSDDFEETEIKSIVNYIYEKQIDSLNKIPFKLK